MILLDEIQKNFNEDLRNSAASIGVEDGNLPVEDLFIIHPNKEHYLLLFDCRAADYSYPAASEADKRKINTLVEELGTKGWSIVFKGEWKRKPVKKRKHKINKRK